MQWKGGVDVTARGLLKNAEEGKHRRSLFSGPLLRPSSLFIRSILKMRFSAIPFVAALVASSIATAIPNPVDERDSAYNH